MSIPLPTPLSTSLSGQELEIGVLEVKGIEKEGGFYCVITNGQVTKRTRSQKAGETTVWKEDFILPVDDNDAVRFEVFGDLSSQRDVSLGVTEVVGRTLKQKVGTDLWVGLKNKDETVGRLHLSIGAMKRSSDIPLPTTQAPAACQVPVVVATAASPPVALPQAPPLSQSPPTTIRPATTEGPFFTRTAEGYVATQPFTTSASCATSTFAQPITPVQTSSTAADCETRTNFAHSNTSSAVYTTQQAFRHGPALPITASTNFAAAHQRHFISGTKSVEHEVARILKVLVVGCEQLQRSASDLKPNPLVTLQIGTQRHTTTYKNNTQDPVWEEEFEFIVNASDVVTATVADKFNPSAAVARARIPGAELLHVSQTGKYLEIELDAETQKAGFLVLGARSEEHLPVALVAPLAPIPSIQYATANASLPAQPPVTTVPQGSTYTTLEGITSPMQDKWRPENRYWERHDGERGFASQVDRSYPIRSGHPGLPVSRERASIILDPMGRHHASAAPPVLRTRVDLSGHATHFSDGVPTSAPLVLPFAVHAPCPQLRREGSFPDYREAPIHLLSSAPVPDRGTPVPFSLYAVSGAPHYRHASPVIHPDQCRVVGEEYALGPRRVVGEEYAMGQGRVVGEEYAMGPRRVVGEEYAMGPRRVVGEEYAMGPRRVVGEEYAMGPRRVISNPFQRY
eukprot:NODE_457_length_2204_cov_110.084738_g375_i1.p1 GENE.NODE_457_length_2204_cov_110.084738_g375_i1~~NODE_457_length_2204_cov_110.084738_g375_i1.p1  ORF type:complete len:698 (+),score=133.39 NODE_457_length_2204_cov_110.084738_g375_i1:43-2094(+)